MARISGIGRLPVTRDLDTSLQEAYRAAAVQALSDAGLSLDDVDGLFLSPAALSGEPWMMFAAGFAEYIGASTRRLGMYENGGCTAFVALTAALDAVDTGACETALVIAGDTRPAWDLTNYEVFVHSAVSTQTSLHGVVNGLYGVGAPIPYYAMCTQRYMYEHGVSPEAIAEVAVRLRSHAAKNPLAQFREPVTVDDVLGSRVLSPPIHLLESASVSSGACAVIVSREKGDRSIPVLGVGEHHTPTHFIPPRAPLTSFEATMRAAACAYDAARVRPGDLDVAEVYGVFAGTELITLEDLGLCERGAAAHAVAEGRTSYGGQVVVNPSGGRICLGHPAGATPLYEVAEIVAQLRGEAGAIQVPGAELGLAQAEHGVMNGVTVMILGKEAR